MSNTDFVMSMVRLKRNTAVLVVLQITLFLLISPQVIEPSPPLQASTGEVFKQGWLNDKLEVERRCIDNNSNKIDDTIERLVENDRLENFASYVVSGDHPNLQVSLVVNFSRPLDEDDIGTLSRIVNRSKVYRFRYLNAVSIDGVSPSVVFDLVKLKDVVMVELQRKVSLRLDTSASAIKARPSSQYSDVWEDLGVDGTGVTIAILDTGVDDEHESLRGKYVAGVDTTGPSDLEFNPDDRSDYGVFHGTHVAGIALGTGGAAQAYRGIAPGARLVDIRVLNEKGEGTTESVIRGIEWAIANKDKENIRVLNMSLGEESASDGKDSLSQAVNEAVGHGIVVVVAAGNDGLNNHIPAPAAADGAITVGALFDHGTIDRTDDTVASYSNRGPRTDDGDSDPYDELKPDVTAPGTYIMSAKGSNGVASNEYHQLSGTSMATPHVAGVAALMLQANPNLTPAEIKEILHETSEARGLPYDPELSEKYNTDFGWGIVDAYAAVSAIKEFGPPDFTLSSQDISFSDNTPVEGQRILITTTIHNLTEFEGTCDLVFYRENTGRPIGRVRGVQVGAGGSTAVSVVRSVQTQGEYRVSIVIENAKPAENNTANNQASASITVGPRPIDPDLTIIQKDIHFPGKIQIISSSDGGIVPTSALGYSAQIDESQAPILLQQTSVTIAPKIYNVGQTAATFDLKIYYDEKIPDKLIDNFFGLFIGAMGDFTATTTWNVPLDLYGDHTIYVVVENTTPRDDDSSNNEASRTLSLPSLMETADVAVAASDITFSDNRPSAGDRVHINVAVHNTGVIDVDNVKVALYVDNVPTSVSTIPYIKQDSDNLASIEWVAVAGGHEIGIYVSLEGVEESNYTNNIASTLITVKPASLTWMILVVIALAIIVAIALGLKIKFGSL